MVWRPRTRLAQGRRGRLGPKFVDAAGDRARGRANRERMDPDGLAAARMSTRAPGGRKAQPRCVRRPPPLAGSAWLRAAVAGRRQVKRAARPAPEMSIGRVAASPWVGSPRRTAGAIRWRFEDQPSRRRDRHLAGPAAGQGAGSVVESRSVTLRSHLQRAGSFVGAISQTQRKGPDRGSSASRERCPRLAGLRARPRAAPSGRRATMDLSARSPGSRTATADHRPPARRQRRRYSKARLDRRRPHRRRRRGRQRHGVGAAADRAAPASPRGRSEAPRGASKGSCRRAGTGRRLEAPGRGRRGRRRRRLAAMHLPVRALGNHAERRRRRGTVVEPAAHLKDESMRDPGDRGSGRRVPRPDEHRFGPAGVIEPEPAVRLPSRQPRA